MTADFDQALRIYVALPDERMEQPWPWREGGLELQVRDALYRSLEEEQAAASVADGGEAARILALAQHAFGDLRGLLVGLDDALLDAVPKPDEWTLRQTLEHLLIVELSYDANTDWARRRGPPVPPTRSCIITTPAPPAPPAPFPSITWIATVCASPTKRAISASTTWSGSAPSF